MILPYMVQSADYVVECLTITVSLQQTMIKQGHLAILTASFLVVGGYAFPASITLLGAHMGRHVTNHSSTVFWKADIKGTGVGNRKQPTKH